MNILLAELPGCVRVVATVAFPHADMDSVDITGETCGWASSFEVYQVNTEGDSIEDFEREFGTEELPQAMEYATHVSKAVWHK